MGAREAIRLADRSRVHDCGSGRQERRRNFEMPHFLRLRWRYGTPRRNNSASWASRQFRRGLQSSSSPLSKSHTIDTQHESPGRPPCTCKRQRCRALADYLHNAYLRRSTGPCPCGNQARASGTPSRYHPQHVTPIAGEFTRSSKLIHACIGRRCHGDQCKCQFKLSFWDFPAKKGEVTGRAGALSR